VLQSPEIQFPGAFSPNNDTLETKLAGQTNIRGGSRQLLVIHTKITSAGPDQNMCFYTAFSRRHH